MVKIRLSRFGTKKHPFYHVVVTDAKYKRDGRFLEQIGTYDPAKPNAEATIDHARVEYWTAHGAQVSETLQKILRDHKKATSVQAA
ncbi:MAG: 30S ribosomal protein S16 [Myxococcales bacterium]|nr:30S ribosomal protein S16 [Myxococcales bacterium]MCB9708647.1 30S ribosomal protein S16 [Myxococcales bacterium]